MSETKLFSPDALKQAVHQSLEDAYAALPEGKSHAVLLDASTDRGIRALYVQRVGDGWNVALQGEWNGKERATGGVSVLKAW